MKHMRITSIMAVVFGLISISMPARANYEGACNDDMTKFCADVKRGNGRMQACMKEHESKLSQACKDDVAKMKDKFREKREEIKEACKPDLQQFCASVTPGEGREFSCLRSYEDKLSPACKEKMPKHDKHKDMMMKKK